jgi:hypothetical protein
MRRYGRLAIVSMVAAACAACSGSGPGEKTTSPGPTTTTASVVASSTPNVSLQPLTSAPAPTLAPPTKEVSLGLVSVRIPQAWNEYHNASGPGSPFGAFGPTIHVKKGYAIARLNISAYDGSIDELAPRLCAQNGQSPPIVPSSVRVLESGFAPVGDRTAQYRHWSAICPNGPEEHRAWVLPVSKVAFWEACASDVIGTIVTNAVVRDAPAAEPIGGTPPSGVQQNCDDRDTTDVTTGR